MYRIYLLYFNTVIRKNELAVNNKQIKNNATRSDYRKDRKPRVISVPSMNVWHAELMPCFTIPVCIIIMPTSERSQIQKVMKKDGRQTIVSNSLWWIFLPRFLHSILSSC